MIIFLLLIFVVQYISQSKSKVIEGELRCQGLLHYIEKIDAPKKVWLSEDGSGVVTKVEYDPSTNQLVGLVLPTNSTTGMPIPFSFLAKSAEAIEKQVHKSRSTLIYLVMAQPLKENVPPYVLLMYGTDNRFSAKSVLHRWQYIIHQLKKLVL